MSRFGRFSLYLAILVLLATAVPYAWHLWAVLVNDPPEISWKFEALFFTLLFLVPAILLIVTLWRGRKRP